MAEKDFRRDVKSNRAFWGEVLDRIGYVECGDGDDQQKVEEEGDDQQKVEEEKSQDDSAGQMGVKKNSKIIRRNINGEVPFFNGKFVEDDTDVYYNQDLRDSGSNNNGGGWVARKRRSSKPRRPRSCDAAVGRNLTAADDEDDKNVNREKKVHGMLQGSSSRMVNVAFEQELISEDQQRAVKVMGKLARFSLPDLNEIPNEVDDDPVYWMCKIQELANERCGAVPVPIPSKYELLAVTNAKKKRVELKRPRATDFNQNLTAFAEKEDEEYDLEEEKKKKKKKKKIVHGRNREREPIVENEVTHRLKEFIENQLHGYELTLVFQRRLTESDLKKDQNRLNMPAKQLITTDFLSEEERRDLERKKGLEVKLIGPTLEEYENRIELKIWEQQTTHNYVFKYSWYNFVQKYKELLIEGKMVQVWSFRRGTKRQLCFAISCVEEV